MKYITTQSHFLEDTLPQTILNLPIAVIKTNDPEPILITNFKPVFNLIDSYAKKLIDSPQEKIDNSAQKHLYFGEHYPISCLSLAFLAGGLTLKLYNTFYEKRQSE